MDYRASHGDEQLKALQSPFKIVTHISNAQIEIRCVSWAESGQSRVNSERPSSAKLAIWYVSRKTKSKFILPLLEALIVHDNLITFKHLVLTLSLRSNCWDCNYSRIITYMSRQSKSHFRPSTDFNKKMKQNFLNTDIMGSCNCKWTSNIAIKSGVQGNYLASFMKSKWASDKINLYWLYVPTNILAVIFFSYLIFGAKMEHNNKDDSPWTWYA